MAGVILFSDVDGTLLDETGRYAITPDELSLYRDAIDLVLASSRTILELSRNQRDLALSGPLVAENGAVVALPWQDSLSTIGTRETIDAREWCVIAVGDEAASIRDAVRDCAFQLGVSSVDQADVESTLGRRASVLLRPVPGANWDDLIPLATSLRHQGFSVASGGSWLAVTGGADKGKGARALLAVLALSQPSPSVVAAVGDGDNDVPLLAVASKKFVISGTDGRYHPALTALPDTMCVSKAGLSGWRDVLLSLLEEKR